MIDYDRLMGLEFPEIEHRYTEKDTILYALGVGYGMDPMDEAQLDYVNEARLKTAATMAVVLAYPGFWYRNLDTGLDFANVVHGSEHIVLDRPLPTSATVVARNRIVDVIDKGAGRGALVISRREIREKASGARLATVTQTAFCRGDGGFGGPVRPSPSVHVVPGRAADFVCSLPTSPQAALIYRLSGDDNPLHSEPATARAAGFPGPVLHGLATFGLVGHALARSGAGRVMEMDCRFSAPVFPGDAVRTDVWRDEDVLSFTAYVGDRLVIGNGRALTQ